MDTERSSCFFRKERRGLRTHRLAHSDMVAFPLGGIGAGMVCLDGAGGFSHVSLRNRPDLMNSPLMFPALTILPGEDEYRTMLLEGPVPAVKVAAFHAGRPTGTGYAADVNWGLPRLEGGVFRHAFPVAMIDFESGLPLEIALTAWSPFCPPEADRSSMPAAALEYHFRNRSSAPLKAVFSFNARNFMAGDRNKASGAVRRIAGGFALSGREDKGSGEGAFAAFIDEPGVRVNVAWFRGGHRFNQLTQLWNEFRQGCFPDREPWDDGHGPGPGASIYLPLELAAGESRTVRLLLAWHVPDSDVRVDPGPGSEPASGAGTYRPWYAGRFASVTEVADHWRAEYPRLRADTFRFARCLQEGTLPAEALEALSANLSIIKSPTVLRQEDGRLWCWEGSNADRGCCAGSCTHVWNYAQAFCHLFPELERSLRLTEFIECQDESGRQSFRAALPIQPTQATRHAAADGQLGGIMKAHREWLIGGDTGWLRKLWPRISRSLDYCIEKWDPERAGVLAEPHHNTYDIEFWGPDSMCSGIYLGALKAAAAMAGALGEDPAGFLALYRRGRAFLEEELFNGEYFFQQVRWRDLRSPAPGRAGASSSSDYRTPEARRLARSEGPDYQYGTGCLADGVLGAWLAEMCGVGEILDPEKVRSHLLSVYRYNFRRDFTGHFNPQRPWYALGREAGLLLCTWPRGGRPSLPFIYSDEVWTGIEYQVAGHLALVGEREKALDIIRAARARYDGSVRNPFDEVECGHWYGRALSSWGLLQALGGVRYDAREKTLYVEPKVPGDNRCFLCTAGGYGIAGVRGGAPFLEVRSGAIEVRRTVYRPFEAPAAGKASKTG